MSRWGFSSQGNGVHMEALLAAVLVFISIHAKSAEIRPTIPTVYVSCLITALTLHARLLRAGVFKPLEDRTYSRTGGWLDKISCFLCMLSKQGQSQGASIGGHLRI